jgi:hypothetical protein
MYFARSCYFGELIWTFIQREISTTEVIQVSAGGQNDNLFE